MSQNVYVIMIDEHMLLDLFLKREVGDTVLLPIIYSAKNENKEAVKLPPDMKIERVAHFWATRQFGFLVSHPSFPVTSYGEEPKRLVINSVQFNVHSKPSNTTNQ